MSSKLESRKGIVARVTPGGLGIVKDDETGHAYYFTFDKIPGYRGESAREAGIREGSSATFLTEVGSAVVTEIEIDSRVRDEAEAPVP